MNKGSDKNVGDRFGDCLYQYFCSRGCKYLYIYMCSIVEYWKEVGGVYGSYEGQLDFEFYFIDSIEVLRIFELKSWFI